MSDRQFRLPRKNSDDPREARTVGLSRSEYRRLVADTQRPQEPQDPSSASTVSISTEQIEQVRRKGQPEQVGKLPARPNPEPRRRPSFLRELGVVVGVALVLSMLVKTFLVQPFWIPSGSMENTLVQGDRVIVSKLTPGPFDLKRGDVVVFADDEHWLDQPNVERSSVANIIVRPLQFVGLYPEGDDHLIKRLIGLPGDRVSCKAGGKLTVNGVALDEPYVYPGDSPCTDAGGEENWDIVVPEGRVWVMGDHRGDSADSRTHDAGSGGKQGSIRIDSITGRAVAIVWPLTRMDGLGNYSSTFDKVPNP